MGQAINPDQNYFADPALDLQAQQVKLARRRALAESLVKQGMSNDIGEGYHGGQVYVVGNPLGNIASSIGGAITNRMADRDQQEYNQREDEATRSVLTRLGTPGMKEQFGPPPEGKDNMPRQPLTPEEESARRLGIYGEGMAVPSLRKVIEAQLGQELDYPRQRETEKAKATIEANRLEAQDKRQAALFAQQGELLDKRIAGQKDLKQMPTIHISQGGGRGGVKAPAGYRYNEDGTALEPIPGGPKDPSAQAPKPLTPKQLETQRGFMDLNSSLDTYENALKTYDFRGKSALDPAARAALEGAYTDLQMKLKTLYELGAPQAGDLKLLEQSLSNPVSTFGTAKGVAFGVEPHKAKVGQIRNLLTNSQKNFETQLGKPTPEAAKPDAGKLTPAEQAELDALRAKHGRK
jgi:hypothetical protein